MDQMDRRDDDGRQWTPRASDAGETGGRGWAADDEAVRRRAYELYRARGGAPGSDLDDWLAAEREVRIGSAGELGTPSAAGELGRDAGQDVRAPAGSAARALADMAAGSALERPADPLADAAGSAPGARDDAAEGMASAARPRTRRSKQDRGR